DWMYGNQDNGETGIVHGRTGRTGCVAVTWTGNPWSNQYRAGRGGMYDLEYKEAEPITETAGQTLTPDTVCASSVRVGARVMRGRDWRLTTWDCPDEGYVGTILDGHSMAGWVTVKWDDREGLYRHRAGYQGKHDLVYFGGIDHGSLGSNYYPTPPLQEWADDNISDSHTDTETDFSPSVEEYSAGERSEASSAYMPEAGEAVSVLDRLRIGARVMMDPDRLRGVRDHVGIGILVGRCGGLVRVRWPNGEEPKLHFANPVCDYRDLGFGECELVYADLESGWLDSGPGSDTEDSESEPDQQTATRSDPAWPGTGAVVQADRLRVGAKVLRGPDWKWGNQDGAEGEETPTPGTVLRRDGTGMVRVEWADGSLNVYRASDPDFDLVYADSDSVEDTLTLHSLFEFP
ncbi:hypothetical protein KIPB_005244, partial [Kipferlia bialata]